MDKEILVAMILGVLTALPINLIFNVHPIACFFMGMFAVGFWLNFCNIIIENPTKR